MHYKLDEHSTADASSPQPPQLLEEDVMILLPVRNIVLFPNVVLPIVIGREQSIAAALEAVQSKRKIGLLLQNDASIDDPEPGDLYRTGTIASILRHVQTKEGAHHIVCQGEQRFRVLDFLPGFPFPVARIERLREVNTQGTEVEARMRYLQQQAVDAIRLLPQAPAELANAILSINSGSALADVVANFLDIEPADKQKLLANLDVQARLEQVTEQVQHRLEVLKLTQKLDQETQQKMNERQREYMLREQLKAIQKELGEDDEDADDLSELEQAITDAEMPEEVEQQARKELKRLRRTPEASGEHAMIRTYLDWMSALPWNKLDEESIDIAKARTILDEDHYGLDKIKKRILEYLAVRKLNPQGRSPILCFVGPPGVGKTSLGQSIARALGLQFVRAALGGVHDEAEIRGHRRTYIGSLPGNIIQSIRKAGVRNPVFMLDEMDKLGASFHGDPASALLEVLDPEQNNTFRDNYLGVPFDLSKVLFIATANVLDNIPGPLRDRMEVIELPGYTEEEKVEIGKRYLLPRQLAANGLQPEQAQVTEHALRHLVRDYTREAGVRNLEREIGALLRSAAIRISEETTEQVIIDQEQLTEILGSRKFESELALRTSLPGVATGLAWTPVGGDILFIETSRAPGNGRLILTGQLGEVMKESAQAALSLVKARTGRLGIDPEVFKDDIHLHVPASAIPKDGPSAGVAMFVSLVSLLSGRTVHSTVAMTGEISLRGLVLPIGGVKEKSLAALRAGIKTVLLPKRNQKDLHDIPASARDQLEFVWLETVDDALDAALSLQALDAAA